jgi:hypothetical protein
VLLLLLLALHTLSSCVIRQPHCAKLMAEQLSLVDGRTCDNETLSFTGVLCVLCSLLEGCRTRCVCVQTFCEAPRSEAEV